MMRVVWVVSVGESDDFQKGHHKASRGITRRQQSVPQSSQHGSHTLSRIASSMEMAAHSSPAPSYSTEPRERAAAIAQIAARAEIAIAMVCASQRRREEAGGAGSEEASRAPGSGRFSSKGMAGTVGGASGAGPAGVRGMARDAFVGEASSTRDRSSSCRRECAASLRA
eukprot:7390013-Prymnesium_polylepis.2